MSARVGPEGGFERAPITTEYQTKSERTPTKSRVLNSHPRSIAPFFEDFVGPVETYEISVPLYSVTDNVNTILVGANSRGRVKVPRTGRLVSAHLLAEDALALHATNHITFTVTNEGPAGSGTVAMLDDTDGANSTDDDLAAAIAITAKTGRDLPVSLTAADLAVVAGDHIAVLATVGGTLANPVTLPVVVLTFATVPKSLTPRVTRTAGSPLVGPLASEANGAIVAQLSATSEAQVAGVDFGDQLVVPASRGPIFSCWLKIPVAITTAQSLVVGLASAYNATFNSVARHAWFRLAASMALTAETDDATTDNDAQGTGTTLVADTWYFLEIDATRPDAVKFYVNGGLVKTLSAPALDTNKLQPACYVAKASGVTTPAVYVDSLAMSHERY